MLPKNHIILGGIFSLIIYLIFQIDFFQAFLIFLSSFLIDIDHYLYYVYKKKDFSLKKAYNFALFQKNNLMKLKKEERSKFYTGFFFLHGLEIVLILFLFGVYFSKCFLFVSLGFLFHLILDYISQIQIYNRLDKIFLLYDFIKFKKLKFLK
jgi:hypothetical protein